MVDISVKVPDVVKSNKPEVKSDEETESKGYDYHEPPAEVHHKEEPSKTKPHEDPHHSTTHEKELSKTKPHEDPHSTTHDNNAEIPVHKPGTQSQDVKLTVEDGSKLSFKEKMKRKNIPGGLTINAFLLLLAGSQNIWCLAFVVLLCTTEFIGISFIREFMTLHWWISLIALGIYMCIYLVTWRMKVRLRVSAACFFLIILATICESTLIVYMALYIDLGAMVSAMVQITFSLYLTACLAQCMKTSYTSILGRTVAIASSLISLIFFMTFEATTVQVVILAVMTGIVSIYLWFMVAQMEHLVHKLDGEMNLLSGIFCALRLYKKKIDMFFALIVFPYTIYKSAQENKNRNSNKEISEPLVKKD